MYTIEEQRNLIMILQKLKYIDPSAAAYVLQQFEHDKLNVIVNSRDAIIYLFTWSDQPQGHAYWLNIHREFTKIIITSKGNIIL